MLKQKLSPTKFIGLGAGLGALSIFLIFYTLSCPKKFEPSSQSSHEAGSPKINFGDPQVSMLGKIQGPYVFIKCISPTLLQISDTNRKLEVVRLIGLGELPYPDPTPTPSPQGLPTPAPEVPALKEQRLKEIQQFKMDGISKLLGSNQLWLVRMNRQPPSQVYLFTPDSMLQPNKPATGGATLVNALLLRQGLANMELNTVAALNHPLFDLMMESQLAALAESQRKAGGEVNLWTKYQMQMPSGPYLDRLEDVKKRM